MCSGELVVGDVVELVKHAVEDVRQSFKVSRKGISGKIKDSLAHRWVVKVAGNDRFGGVLRWGDLLHNSKSRDPANRSERRLDMRGNNEQIAKRTKEVDCGYPPWLNGQGNSLFRTKVPQIPILLDQHQNSTSSLVWMRVKSSAVVRAW